MEKLQEIVAGLHSYVALSGICWISAAGLLVLKLTGRGDGTLTPTVLSVLIGLGWCWWLSGFRMSLYNTEFHYRNGFYKTKVITLSDIQSLTHQWIDVEWGLKTICVPRTVIELQNGEKVIINDKPFKPRQFRELRVQMEKMGVAGVEI